MRCPNCGNENPPDYVFCDECGARLLGGDDVAANAGQNGAAVGAVGAVGQTTADAAPVGMGSQAQQGGSPVAGSYGSSPVGQDQSQYGVQYGSVGGDSGPMDQGSIGGQDTVAYQSASENTGPTGGNTGGIGDAATAGAGAADGAAAGDFTPYGADQQATQATYGEAKGIGAGPSATNMTGVSSGGFVTGEGTGADMPVTEDTVQPVGAQANQGWQPGADESDMYSAGTGAAQDASMPGIVEIDDEDEAGADATYTYAPVSSGESYSEAGTTGATSASVGQDGGAWASQALSLLDEAQAALGRGDWSGFGSGMAQLRDYLTNAGSTAGAAGSTVATGASGASASPAATWTSEGTASSYAPATTSTAGTTQDSTYSATEDSGYDVAADTGTSGGGAQPYADTTQQAGGAATLEPVTGAGAGTVGGDQPPSTIDYEVDYSASYGGADASAGAGTDVAEDTGLAASGAAAGAAAMGGLAGSTNGATDTTMARLVIISTGAELPLPDQEEIMVGREDPSSGIFPDVDLTPYGGEEGGVSRRHARLLSINGEFFVEDLQSTNFTKLDGQRLPAHVRERLEDGARIDFGRVATIFRRS